MHGARILTPVITLKNLLRRTCCPQARGRCSVTGRLWPPHEGMVKPARQPASGGRPENSTATRRSTRVTSSFPQADAALGKARMRLSHRGLRLHARVTPAAFPSVNLCHFWKGVNAELDLRQPWKQGSPRADRGDQPGKPGHSLRHGAGMGEAVGFMPRRTRHRERHAAPPGMWTRHSHWNGGGGPRAGKLE